MIRSHQARLRALEERAEQGDDDYIIFGWSEDADGRVTSYHVQNDGRNYSPEAFDRLIDELPGAVFVPLQAPSPLAEAAARAYWSVKESYQPTLDELMAENAAVERSHEAGGDGADGSCPRLDRLAEWEAMMDPGEDDAWTRDVTAASDEVTLARYHAWLMERAEPWYEEMAARKARLDGRSRR